LRWVIAVAFVLWGCGEARTYPQPANNTGDAKATTPNRITAHELEGRDEPDEQEEEPDEQEDPEEPDEQEEEQDDEEEPDEQDEDQMDEPEPDPEVSTPGSYFNYEEWTAELPTYGKPKVPGPPYPYLEAGGKKELFDRLRRYRWLVWEQEQTIDLEEAWVVNWEQWEKEGHPVRLTKEECKSGKLRENDSNLKTLFRKYEPRTKVANEPVLDYDLENKLRIYGGKAAYNWYLYAKRHTAYYYRRGESVKYIGTLPRKRSMIRKRAGKLRARLGWAAGCGATCPSPVIGDTLKCQEWKDTFMED